MDKILEKCKKAGVIVIAPHSRKNKGFDNAVNSRDRKRIIKEDLLTILDCETLHEFYTVSNNLEKIWYSLDNGLHNVTVNSFIGVIDQIEWSALPEGHVTIQFFANDTVGNLGYGEIIVIKEIVAIPGFNFTTVYFLFFAISLLLLI